MRPLRYFQVLRLRLFARNRTVIDRRYNCFAEENGKESIDVEAIERSPGRKVDHFLKEWVMLSRSKVLVACGEIFAARDEVLALLRTDDRGTNP